MSDEKFFDDYVTKQVAPIVRECGWMVQGVFPTEKDEPERRSSWWGYSVGLHDKGWPELALIGMMPEKVQTVINLVAHHCVDRNAMPVPGELHGVINEPYYLRLRPCRSDSTEYPLSVAHRWARTKPVAALQIVWPDPEGRFPGDPGYDYVEWEQPMIEEVGW